MKPKPRLAYITTHYPALSHTFILGEVEALRRRGLEIHTISLRRVSGEHLLGSDNRAAWASTYAVRPPRWPAVLGAHLAALLSHPRAYLLTLIEATRLARAGARAKLWQLFYFAEAVLVWRHCAAREVGHIHAHHGSPPADVALLAAHFGALAQTGPRSWSLTMHGSVEFWNVERFNLAEKIRRARAVVCISDFARSQLMALVEEAHWPKLQVVHCGISPPHAQPSPPPARERPRLLYVARLVPEKGHAVLMRALTILRARGHDAELVLVGDGPGRARLEALACELGLSDRLTFAGAVAHEQMPRQYAACSVFCLPSFSEGVPVVLMEAMACRVPVVASAVGGVRELVHDNSTGLLVSPGRPDQLAKAIARLLEHHELRERLGEAGRAHVLREFDVEHSAAALEGIFEGLAAEGGARPQRETLRRSAQAPSSHHAAGEALEPEAGALTLPLESAVGQ